jgi:hypothetical protein
VGRGCRDACISTADWRPSVTHQRRRGDERHAMGEHGGLGASGQVMASDRLYAAGVRSAARRLYLARCVPLRMNTQARYP